MTEASSTFTESMRRAEQVRAASGLTAIGGSLGLALGAWLGPWQSTFVDNRVPQSGRLALLACIAGGALFGLVLVGLAWLGARAKSLPTLARFLAPLALLGFLPSLLRSEEWPSAVDLSIALAVVVLISRPLFRMHFRAYQEPALSGLIEGFGVLSRAARQRLPAALRGKAGLALVIAAALAYGGYMSLFTVLNHFRFGTNTWDLSQFDSEFYNTLHGKPFRCPALILDGPAWSDLANHAHFAIWLLTPLYALHPAAETLLVLQALIIGAGAIPLYRFAARRLPRASSVLVALAYLLYPPLHGAQFFDFHFQPIAGVFVLFAIDFLDERRLGWFSFFFIAALASREDVAIGLAAIGVYVLLFTKRTWQGATITGVSLLYFGVMKFAVMPAFGTWGFADFYKPLVPAGQSGFGAVIVTLVTNPVFAFKTLLSAEKLRYALQILTPIAFLPLSRPRLWLSLVLGSLVTLLTSGAAALLDIGFQYGGSFAAYVFLASVLALASEGRSPLRAASPDSVRVERRVSLFALCLGTLLTTLHWGAIPPRERFHTAYNTTLSQSLLTEEERERLESFRKAMALIPRDAIVAAGDRELPHVSNRMDAWNMNVGYERADFLLYQPAPMPDKETAIGLRAQAQGWTVVAQHKRFVLLKSPKKK